MALIRYIGEEGLERAPATEAAEILRDSGVAIIPADTMYGLSARADNPEAVARINRIKGRPENTPQIVLLHYEWVENFVADVDKIRPLIDAFMPGPLTIIAPAKEGTNLADFLMPDGKIAFRISESWFANEVMGILGVPITSTSANTTATPPLSDQMDIISQFDELVDGIFLYRDVRLDGPPSTMIDATNFPEVKLIREGAIPFEAITEYIQREILGGD